MVLIKPEGLILWLKSHFLFYISVDTSFSFVNGCSSSGPYSIPLKRQYDVKLPDGLCLYAISPFRFNIKFIKTVKNNNIDEIQV